MGKAGFSMAMAAGFFSMFLLGWRGYEGHSADWIYGFLAVFWSLLMMLRIMILTEMSDHGAPLTLAQKIIASFREKQEETRQLILESAFGGSFTVFLAAGILFAAWQVFCAAFPADAPTFEGLRLLFDQFFASWGTDGARSPGGLYDWGQGFMLFLSLAMMGFVLRSYARDREMIRAMLLVLCAYAVSGYIAFSGLPETGGAVEKAALVGNGAGTLSYLLSTLAPTHTPSLFDIMLVESGIGGIAILTLILFIPLGSIALSAQARSADGVVIFCGVANGLSLILAIFLPFSPALAGYIGLCCMGIFLAWGASENGDLPALRNKH